MKECIGKIVEVERMYPMSDEVGTSLTLKVKLSNDKIESFTSSVFDKDLIEWGVKNNNNDTSKNWTILINKSIKILTHIQELLPDKATKEVNIFEID